MTEREDEREELLALIRAARAQLEFYREMGITKLGGYTKVSPVVESTETVEDMAKKKKTPPPEEQASLFDLEQSSSGTRAKAAKTRKASSETLHDIRAEVGHCSQLCKGATQVVFGEGNPKADLMFVGEAPGADEDATGRPFVGAAGRLLDKIIEAMGLKREEVYITNVVKCRPPNNRKPTTEEVESCEPFLFREIDVIKPKVIVTLGATPLFSLLRVKEGITKIRGNFYEYQGIPVMPTFHPAFLLRVPERKREVWDDMKKVKAKLEER
jgi:uracil-DNA glycosylase